MHTDEPQMTPEEARTQLAASRARPLDSASDRTVHACGTAVFGVAMGTFMATRTMTAGWGEIALTLVFASILVAQVIVVERAARAVPRRATRWSRLGIGASLLVGLAVVLPWLNLQAQTDPISGLQAAVAAVVVAVPSLLAAAVIARGSR